MATGAAAGSIEISAAGLSIAGCEIAGIDGAASTGHAFELDLLVMNEGYDCVQVRVAQVKRGHPLLFTARANYGADLVAARIGGNQRGAREVGTGLSPRGIATVAKAAIG